MSDRLIRAIAADGGIRAVGTVTTTLTEEARVRHKLSYVATAALGQAMSSGLLLASNMKQQQSRVTIRIKGEGPLGGIFVDAGVDGTVRGYVEHPKVELPPNSQGDLDVKSAVGRYGYLHVMRDVGYGQPYYSTVELISGEVGSDVANYLATSEQTPSALLVGVFVDSEGVNASGGILLQILPKAVRDEALIELLESRVNKLSGFTRLLLSGKSLSEILEELLGDLGLIIFPQPKRVRFNCRCSFQRVLGALKLLGEAELQDMIEKDSGAEATCEFCGEVYQASSEELEGLIEDLRSQSV
ncbi:MAG: Hsp33 family molecular chaperone HslO [Prochloraceae cyanobacterium]|nr:Hsp33 family molecular chaperone HslO [Prochloraceae cyanobacterium]